MLILTIEKYHLHMKIENNDKFNEKQGDWMCQMQELKQFSRLI